jgi:hypothetical protein
MFLFRYSYFESSLFCYVNIAPFCFGTSGLFYVNKNILNKGSAPPSDLRLHAFSLLVQVYPLPPLSRRRKARNLLYLQSISRDGRTDKHFSHLSPRLPDNIVQHNFRNTCFQHTWVYVYFLS